MLQKKPPPPSSSLQIQNSDLAEEAKTLLLCKTVDDEIVYTCKNIISKLNSLNDVEFYINNYLSILYTENKIDIFDIQKHPDGISVRYKTLISSEVKLLDFTFI